MEENGKIFLYKIIKICYKWLSFISTHCCTIHAHLIFNIVRFTCVWSTSDITYFLKCKSYYRNTGTAFLVWGYWDLAEPDLWISKILVVGLQLLKIQP